MAAPPETRGTRDRILDVALDEFAEKGVAGARVNDIAKNAGVNIRMIYHYFGSKQGLFHAVTDEVFRRRSRIAALAAGQEPPPTPEEFLLTFFTAYTTDRRLVRLLEWEALEAFAEHSDLSLADPVGRSATASHRLQVLDSYQRQGLIDPDIDLRMLYVAMVSLTLGAVAFPPTVQFATGMHPWTPEFVAQYREALRHIGPGLFRPSQAH
ncbi:MAG TPA: TetR/AcrR family transcriptional regulator [Microbacteriaceae bacterium]|nr:TetR/AcrR family transcriptional regulator [Microbacteriaceae bacterium]